MSELLHWLPLIQLVRATPYALTKSLIYSSSTSSQEFPSKYIRCESLSDSTICRNYCFHPWISLIFAFRFVVCTLSEHIKIYSWKQFSNVSLSLSGTRLWPSHIFPWQRIPRQIAICECMNVSKNRRNLKTRLHPFFVHTLILSLSFDAVFSLRVKGEKAPVFPFFHWGEWISEVFHEWENTLPPQPLTSCDMCLFSWKSKNV